MIVVWCLVSLAVLPAGFWLISAAALALAAAMSAAPATYGKIRAAIRAPSGPLLPDLPLMPASWARGWGQPTRPVLLTHRYRARRDVGWRLMWPARASRHFVRQTDMLEVRLPGGRIWCACVTQAALPPTKNELRAQIRTLQIERVERTRELGRRAASIRDLRDQRDMALTQLARRKRPPISVVKATVPPRPGDVEPDG